MNILIKLMSIVSLVIAPSLASIHHDKIINNRQAKMQNLIYMNANPSDHTNIPGITPDKNSNDIKTILGGLKNDKYLTSVDDVVEIRGERLFVNGGALPEEVNNRYKKYLQGKGDILITERANPNTTPANVNSDIKAILGGLKNDKYVISVDDVVEIRGERLFVNGEELPEEVNTKYRKYLQGKADIIITERKVK